LDDGEYEEALHEENLRTMRADDEYEVGLTDVQRHLISPHLMVIEEESYHQSHLECSLVSSLEFVTQQSFPNNNLKFSHSSAVIASSLSCRKAFRPHSCFLYVQCLVIEVTSLMVRDRD
jgi:hypothetical protein